MLQSGRREGVSAPSPQCMLGYTPTVDRILETRLWKHYLPATMLRTVKIGWFTMSLSETTFGWKFYVYKCLSLSQVWVMDRTCWAVVRGDCYVIISLFTKKSSLPQPLENYCYITVTVDHSSPSRIIVLWVMVLWWKKWLMASFLVADGPFFAAGPFLTHFPPTCDHNILTCD